MSATTPGGSAPEREDDPNGPGTAAPEGPDAGPGGDEAAGDAGAAPEGPGRTLLGRPAQAWWRLARQLVSYGVLGGLGAVCDFGAYTGLVHLTPLSRFPVVANIISVLVGIFVSFMLNSRITFKARDHSMQRAARFFTVGLSGLGLSSGLLAVLTHGAGMDPVIAKLITVPPVVLFQFLANRHWSFRAIDGSSRRRRLRAESTSAWAPPLVHGALLALVLACYGVLFIHEARSGLEFDEAYNLEIAKNLASGHGYAAYGWETGTQFRLFDPRITTGPTLLLPAALLWRLGGGALWLVRLVPLSCFALYLFSIWRLSHRRLGRWAGLGTLCAPLLIHVALADDLLTRSLTVGRMVGEFAACAFILAAVLALSSRDRTLLGGLMAGLAVQTKDNFLVAGALVMLAWLAARWLIDRRFPLRKSLFGALGAVAPTAAFELYRLAILGSPSAYRASVNELLAFVRSQSSSPQPQFDRIGTMSTLIAPSGWLVLGLIMILFVILAMNGGRRLPVERREQRVMLSFLLCGVVLGAAGLLYTWVVRSTQSSPRQGLPTVLLALPVLIMATFAALQALMRAGSRIWFWAEKALCLLLVALAVWAGAHEARSTSEHQRLLDQRAAVAYLEGSGVSPSLPNYQLWHLPELLVLSDLPSETSPGAAPATVDVFTSHMAVAELGTPDARLFETTQTERFPYSCHGPVLFENRNVVVCARP